jgi:hypothetical protein
MSKETTTMKQQPDRSEEAPAAPRLALPKAPSAGRSPSLCSRHLAVRPVQPRRVAADPGGSAPFGRIAESFDSCRGDRGHTTTAERDCGGRARWASGGAPFVVMVASIRRRGGSPPHRAREGRNQPYGVAGFGLTIRFGRPGATTPSAAPSATSGARACTGSSRCT